jgi:hypothetical protein
MGGMKAAVRRQEAEGTGDRAIF